jgi:hypothetical protein
MLIDFEARSLCKKVHWNPALKKELKHICEHEKIKYKTLKHLISTQWNSLRTMLVSLLDIQITLDKLCTWKCKQSKAKACITKYKLSGDEWSLFEAVLPLTDKITAVSLLSLRMIFLRNLFWLPKPCKPINGQCYTM